MLLLFVVALSRLKSKLFVGWRASIPPPTVRNNVAPRADKILTLKPPSKINSNQTKQQSASMGSKNAKEMTTGQNSLAPMLHYNLENEAARIKNWKRNFHAV